MEAAPGGGWPAQGRLDWATTAGRNGRLTRKTCTLAAFGYFDTQTSPEGAHSHIPQATATRGQAGLFACAAQARPCPLGCSHTLSPSHAHSASHSHTRPSWPVRLRRSGGGCALVTCDNSGSCSHCNFTCTRPAHPCSLSRSDRDFPHWLANKTCTPY